MAAVCSATPGPPAIAAPAISSVPCDEADVRVFVLGSGSSGNALMVESRGTRLMIEAGIGPRVVTTRLAELGIDLRPGGSTIWGQTLALRKRPG